jgi:hypothetical protein
MFAPRTRTNVAIPLPLSYLSYLSSLKLSLNLSSLRASLRLRIIVSNPSPRKG